MSEEIRGGRFRTYTGREFHPFDPRQEEVCLEDIAHPLSNLCRFAGHCSDFFSIAQHSVMLSLEVERNGGDRALQLAALHDSSWKAYLPEVLKPLRRSFEIQAYGLPNFEPMDHTVLRLWSVISQWLGVPSHRVEHYIIQEEDEKLLRRQARDLMGDPCDWWDDPVLFDLGPRILPLNPHHAKIDFLSRHSALTLGLERTA